MIHSGFIQSTLEIAFPAVAKRYRESAAWHKATYGIEPLFGGFWNFCLNGIFEGHDRIQCRPHADAKNPVGICVLMVYVLPGGEYLSVLNLLPSNKGMQLTSTTRSVLGWLSGKLA